MKIFLIETPISLAEYQAYRETKYTIWTPPLWMLSLAAFLKEELPRASIKLLDGQLISFNRIKREILKEKPDIVGFSPKHQTYKRFLRLARISKKIGAKVVVGGLYADSLAREIILNRGLQSRDYCIDAVIKGDGEKAFSEYVDNRPLEKINNLVYQDKDGIKENPVVLLDLNKLPILDFSLINLEEYFQDYQKRYPFLKNRRIIRTYTQKGCAWRKINKKGCIFCTFSSGAMRLRNPGKVWQEISQLVKKHQVNQVRDISDLSFGDKNWFNQFYKQAIKDKTPLPCFSANFRIGSLDNSTLKKMSQLNLVHVTLGIESGHPQTLKRLNTGINLNHVYKTVKMLADYDISMTPRFITGAPGEDKKTLASTVKLAKQLSKFKQVDRIVASQFSPFPNSYAWCMLLSRIGNKYKNQDFINFRQSQSDWQKHFCKVNGKVLGQASNIINQLK